jgi:cytosine/adenosine deaminase-related metal-dependent hydrolase
LITPKTGGNPETGALTLSNVTIFAGPDLDLIPRGFIEIRGDRIFGFGEGSAGLNTHQFDCEGLIAIPGFIDAHTHVGDSVAKEAVVGLPIAEAVSPSRGLKQRILASTSDVDLTVAMRESLTDMICSGITTFADFREGGTRGVTLLLKAAEGLPLRPVVFARLAQVPFSSDELAGNSARLPSAALEEVNELLSKADGISTSTANDLTDPAMEQINHLASDKGKLKAIHVAEAAQSVEKSKLRTGRGDVERVTNHFKPDFVVHMTNATNSDVELVAKSRASVVCCPRANALLGVGVPPVTRIIAGGINVALGTDNVMLNQPDMFREMDYTARVIRGVERDPSRPACKEVLKMATVNGAKALKMEKDIGSIEVGKIADIVLIDGADLNLRHSRDIVSSLVLRAGVHNVRMTLAGGRVVYERPRPRNELPHV